jgi:hypothetical protein
VRSEVPDIGLQDLSHDDSINKAYIKDPLVIQKGTLKGVSDMLDLVSLNFKTRSELSSDTLVNEGRGYTES